MGFDPSSIKPSRTITTFASYCSSVIFLSAEVFTFPMPPSAGPYDIKPQMIAYLGGEAGTGKSTVIHAILRFARGWNRPRTVDTMAFTGVAAINIDGKTIHSARNLSVGRRQGNSPAMEMKQRFQKVV